MHKYDPQFHYRKSYRLKGYDYSQEGLYFLTICCKNRKCLFGKIENGKMILNKLGEAADECWKNIPKHFPNAVLHQYIVMPNHIHGIIELGNNMGSNGVGTKNFSPLPIKTEFKTPFKSPSKTIGSIIRGFKIGVTILGKEILPDISIWQRNYYDHIIRDRKSYRKISDYILKNPLKWKNDKFYIYT